MIPTCNWRQNSPQPGAEEENWVVKQAGIITARQQTPVVLLKTDLKIEWIAFKSIYACLHVAVQQIQDVWQLTSAQFSFPTELDHVSLKFHMLPIFHIYGLFFGSVSTSYYIM